MFNVWCILFKGGNIVLSHLGINSIRKTVTDFPQIVSNFKSHFLNIHVNM